MIENLQDELYQLEKNKQKVLNIVLIRAKNTEKIYFKVLERQNLQNQTIYKFYSDDNKSKYSSDLKDIFKSAKKFYEKLYI